ncbi:mucin-19-like [Protopterus annectens]|uniref:mucin-19-like n=1 Tax=Protopterus annectens TaxID=7888 RepID=UPI001CFC286F|nr:mucin-19-like [Protopterus annectens]
MRPTPVTNFVVVSVTSSSIFVSWTAVPGDQISYRLQAVGPTNSTITTSATSYKMTGLVSASQYNLSILAIAADNATISDVTSIIRYTSPSDVTQPSVVNVTATSVFVSWGTPPGNQISYRIQITGPPSSSLTVTTPYVSLPGLNPGSAYTFAITPVAADNVTLGNPVTLSIFTKPVPVSSLTVLSATTSSISLSWGAVQGSQITYRLQAVGPSNSSTTVSATSTTLSGLVSGSRYNISIIAVAADNITSSDATSTTRYTRPTSVTNFAVVSSTSSSIYLLWTGVQGDQISYRLQAVGPTNSTITTSATSYNMTGLVSASQYNLSILSVDADNSTVSDVTSISGFTSPGDIPQPSVVNATATSVFVSWGTPPGNQISYRIQVIGPPSSSLTVNTPYVSLSGLNPGSAYTITLTPVAADNVTLGNPVTFSVYTKPVPVTSLNVTSATTSSISLSWSAVQGIQITYRLQAVGPSNSSTTVSTTSATLSGLVSGSKYNISIIAVAADNVTSSDAASATGYTKPAPVTNFVVVNATSSIIYLSWAAVPGDQIRYRIQAVGPINSTITTSATSYNMTGLASAMQYNLSIIAIDADNSTVSDVTSIVGYTSPGDVTQPSVVNATATSVFVSWGTPPGNQISYRLQVTGPPSSSLTVTTPYVSLSGLNPGSAYTITITPVAADNVTQGNPATLFVFTKPVPVISLTVTSATTSSISLSWGAVQGSQITYRLQAVGPSNASTTVSTTSATLSGLVSGSRYNISIVAVAADNVTSSDAASATGYTRPATVTNFAVVNATSSTIYLSWTAVPGDQISYRIQTAGPSSSNITTSATRISMTGLVSASQYNFSILAVAADSSTVSDVTSITGYTSPGDITQPSVVNATATSVFISWGTPPGNQISYRIQVTGAPSSSLTVTTPSVSLSGLNSGSAYAITITPVAADNVTLGNPATLSIFTKPVAVTSLNVTSATTSSISLSWAAVQGSQITYRLQAVGPSNSSTTVSTTSTTLLGLVSGSKYNISITAVAADNVTSSDAASATGYTRPAPVTNFVVVNATSSTIYLSWTAVPGDQISYKIQTAGPSSSNITTSATRISMTGLVSASQYNFSILAVAADNSTVSDVTFVTGYTSPGDVTQPSVVNATATSVFVSWGTPPGNQISYRIQVTGPPSSYLTVTTPYVSLSGLNPSSAYIITITPVAADNVTLGNPVILSIFTKPVAVTSLNVTSATTSSISLSWGAVQGSQITYRLQAVGPSNSSTTVSTTSTTLSGLVSGSRYNISIIAVAADNVTSSDAASATAYTRPAPVTNFVVVNATSSTIYLSWTAVPGDQISYRIQTAGPFSSNITTSATRISMTGLVSASQYNFSILAVAADNSTVSDVTSVTGYTSPGDVIRPSVVNATATSVFVSWGTPPGNQISYRIQVTGPPSSSLTVTTPYVSLPGLNPGSAYTISISPVAADNITLGNPATLSIFTKPVPVTSLNVTSATTSSISLSWGAVQGSQITYRLQAVGPSNSSTTVSTTSATLSGLVSGSRYNISIIAVAADNVTSSDAASATGYTRPAPVTNFAVVNATSSTIYLSWSAVPGDQISYRIQTAGPSSSNITTSATRISMTGLVSASQYNFSILAVAADNSTVSDVTSATGYTSPGDVTQLSVVNATATSVFVSWGTPPGNQISYRIQITGPPSSSLTVTTPYVSLPGLNPGSAYTITITPVAADNVTLGNPATLSIFTKPVPVTSLTVTSSSTSSISLSWGAVQGSQITYRLQAVGPSNASTTVSTTSATLSGLVSGSKYNISIVAVAADNVTSSDGASAAGYTRPAPVTNFVVVNATSSTIYLSWTAVPGDQISYRIQTAGPSSSNITTSATRISMTGLVSASQYNFSILAVAADNSTVSDVTSITGYTSPGDVTQPSVVNATATSVFVSWGTPPGNQISYRIQITGPPSSSLTVTTPYVSLSGLNPGSAYNISITPVAADNVTLGNPATLSIFTKPVPVTSLNVTSATTSSISLSWGAVQGSQITYRLQAVGPSNSSTTVSTTSTTLSGLVSGFRYSISIVAVAADNVTLSDAASATGYTRPAPVTNFVVVNATSSTIYLSWTAVPGDQISYRIQTAGPSSSNITTSATRISMTGLVSASQYNFSILAVAADNSTVSDVTYVTGYTSPSDVTLPTVVNATATSVFVSWGTPPGNQISYRIQITGPPSSSLTVTTPYVSLLGLNPGSPYTITITPVAADNVTLGNPATLSIFTKPVPVTSLTVTSATTSLISLSWGAVQGSQITYRLQAVGPSNSSTTVSTTSTSLSGLVSGSRYNISIIAIAADNVTSSDATSATGYTRPAPVTNFVVVNATSSTIYLSWSAVPGDQISYRIQTAGPSSSNITTFATRISMTGLVSASQYNFSILAVAADNSTVSDVTSVTGYTSPSDVTRPSVVNATTTSVFVSWGTPPGNQISYRIQITGPPSSSLTVTTSYVSLSGLNPSSAYIITITPVAADNVTLGNPATLSIFTKPVPVTSLNVTSTTTSSISLSWGAVQGSQITYRLQGVGPSNSSTTVSTTSTTLLGLVSGSKYNISIIAVAADNITSSDAASATGYTRPAPVTNFVVVNATSSTIYLSWTAVPGDQISYRIQTAGPTSSNITTSATRISMTGLVSASQYNFSILAVAADNSTVSDVTSITGYTSPGDVTQPSVVNATTTSVFVSWGTPPGNQISYRIQVTGPPPSSLTVTTPYVSLLGLNPGSTYTITITPVAADNVTLGNPATLSIFTKPVPVTSLTVTSATTSSISLSWGAVQGIQITYRLQALGPSNSSTTVSATSTTLSGLVSGSRYNISIVAVAADNVTSSDAASATGYTRPAPVTNFVVVNATSSTIYLSWSAVPGDQISYRIQTAGPSSSNITTSATRISMTGLVSASQYNFSILAVAADNSTVSDVTSATGYTSPGDITQPSVVNATATSVFVSWGTPPGNQISYRIQVTGPPSSSLTVTTTYVSLSGLNPASAYTITITPVAADNVTLGNPATLSIFTKPVPVISLTVTSATTSSISLSWGAVQGSQITYRLQAVGPSNASTTVSTTSATLSGLVSGSRYNISIVAVAADNVTSSDAASASGYTRPAPVTNFVVVNATSSTIYLSWTAVPGDQISYRIQTAGPSSSNITTSATRISMTGLVSASQYNFSILAVAADSSTVSDVSSVTGYTSPGNITQPTVINATATSVFVSWGTPPGNQISYRIQITGPPSSSLTVATPYVSLSGLNPGSAYTITITPVAADNVTLGNPVMLSIFTKPTSVTNFTVVGVTTSSASLSWTASQGSQITYRVQVTGPTSSNFVVSAPSVNVTGLTAGSQYTFIVTAVAADNATTSDVVSVSGYTKPTAVSNLAVVSVTDSSASLSWNASQGNQITYRVQATGPSSSSLTVLMPNTTVTGLVSGSQYSFRVSAVAADNVTTSDVTSVSGYTKPVPVTNSVVVSVTSSSAYISWNAAQGSQITYRIQTTGPTSSTFIVSASSVNLTGLVSGATYRFSITAVAADNVTASDAVTLSGSTKPTPVTNFTIVTVTTTSASLSWNASQGSQITYRVQATGSTLSLTVSTPSATIIGLAAGSLYTFTVTALASDNVTAADAVSVSGYTKPTPVINVVVISVTTSSASLSWNTSQGSQITYRVQVTGPTSSNLVVSAPSVNVTGLTAGSQYNFSLTAVAADNATISDITSIVRYTIPAAAKNLVASAAGTNAAHLTWSVPDGNYASFFVQVVGPVNQTVSTANTSADIYGLKVKTNYTLLVYCVAADNTTRGLPETTFLNIPAPSNWCAFQDPPLCCSGSSLTCHPESASCYCDEECQFFGDCCEDHEMTCHNI